MAPFGSKQTLEYVTPIKGGVTKEQAIAVLHDPEFYLSLDPHRVSTEKKDGPKGKLVLPDEIKARKVPGSETTFYEQKDKIPGIAAKLVPGKTTSTSYYQFTLLTNGLFLRTEALLDTVLNRELIIREGSSGLELVEIVKIEASRLVMSTVVSENMANARAYHEGIIMKMRGQPGETSGIEK